MRLLASPSPRWVGTALDIDPRLVDHAREIVGVDAVRGSIGKIEDLGPFDLINVFRFGSIALLSRKAGFLPIEVDRLRESSTKYKLRAFLMKPDGAEVA